MRQQHGKAVLTFATGIRYYQANPGDTCQGIVDHYSGVLSMDDLWADPYLSDGDIMADVSPVSPTTQRPEVRVVVPLT